MLINVTYPEATKLLIWATIKISTCSNGKSFLIYQAVKFDTTQPKYPSGQTKSIALFPQV